MNLPPVSQTSPQKMADQWHGLANGLDQLDKETYEALVSSEEMLQFLNQKLAEKNAQFQQLTKAIQEAHQKLQAKKEDRWRFQEKISLCTDQLDRVQKKANSIQQEMEQLQETYIRRKPTMGVFMGLVFFLAGWVFIVGDLIISHEIVAYALQIKGHFESWAFAVGLALLSLLLKPAYDHWIEKPSQVEGNEKNYRFFHATLAIVTLFTLGILGWFRFEAYQVEQRKMEVNRQLRQLQLQLEEASSPDFPATIQQKMETLSTLSMTLVDSPKALFSFILSGLLFALAGAVCLGMGLPILQYHFEKWTYFRPRYRKLADLFDQLDEQLGTIQQEKIKFEWAYEACLEESIPLPLEMEKNQLQQEIESIQEKIIRARENIRISQYSEGYQRGLLARKTLSMEELQQWRHSWGVPGPPSDSPFSFSSYLHT